MIPLLCASAFAHPLDETAAEAEAGGKYLTARRLAEQIVAEEPDSFTGHYVLGKVEWNSQGNLGKARFHLEKAEELWEAKYGAADPAVEVPTKQHSDVLFALYNVCAEMEDADAAFYWMDHQDQFFDPPVGAWRAWPLMKAGRTDEARAIAEAGAKSDSADQRSAGLNTLCALEAEAGFRQAAYEACKAALDDERKVDAPDLTVDAANAAFGAWQILRFDEAEDLLKESSTGSAENTTNPYAALADLYLTEARGADAIGALGEMQRWRLRQPNSLRDQSRASLDALYAGVLAAAGDSEKASEVIDRAIRFPDRRAMISTDDETTSAGHALLRLRIRALEAQRRAEDASTRWFGARLWHWLKNRLPDTEAWGDRAKIRAALADDERLDDTFRVYVDGGIASPLLIGDLAGVLGAGVTRAALADARRRELMPEFTAYYDAIEVDILVARGDRQGAFDLAAATVDLLPAQEKRLRAQLAATAASSAWALGDEDAAIEWYGRAMQDDPGAIRQRGHRLPATIEGPADGPAGLAANMLGYSPRFRGYGAGFKVSVSGGADRVEVCLLTPMGSRLSCEGTERPAPAEGEEPLDDTEFARLAVMNFHRAAFSLPMGASTADLHSLDGTTTVAGEEARKRAKAILDGL